MEVIGEICQEDGVRGDSYRMIGYDLDKKGYPMGIPSRSFNISLLDITKAMRVDRTMVLVRIKFGIKERTTHVLRPSVSLASAIRSRSSADIKGYDSQE